MAILGGLASPLAEPIRQFLAHKRALARRYLVEEKALRLLDRYLVETGVQSLRESWPRRGDRAGAPAR
jgi:hypothetical protein